MGGGLRCVGGGTRCMGGGLHWCWDYDDEVEGETKDDHGAYCNAVLGSRMGLSVMMIGKQVVTKRSVG